MILLKDDAVKDGVCTLNCISLSRISAQINIYTGKWEKMKSYVKRHCSQVLDSIVSFLYIKKIDRVQMTMLQFKQTQYVFCKFERYVSYCGKMISHWIEFDHCYFYEEVLTA